MTDSTGLLQHAIYGVPRRESGYTIDDNARALRLCVRLWALEPDERMLSRITTFLSMLEYSRRPGGGFHNLMSYQRQWLGTDATGDCQGQAIRAAAEVLASRLPADYRALAHELIDGALPSLAELRSLRGQAYILIAFGHLWLHGVHCMDRLERLAWQAATHLAECHQRSRRPDWHWFESRMTYANAVLPHALFVAARRWPSGPFLDIARESFAFLDERSTANLTYWPVGNDGWYPHGESKAPFDQQPIEAATHADAALTAHEVTGDDRYLHALGRAHRWFFGENSNGVAVADARTGSCFDGLQPHGLNRNQGAESTLAYLWTELHRIEAESAQRDDDAQRTAASAALGIARDPRRCELDHTPLPAAERAISAAQGLH
jgi:hypothetical protein